MIKVDGQNQDLVTQNSSFGGLMSLQNSCFIPSRAIDTSCDVTVKSETTASCLCGEHCVHDYSSEPHTCCFAYSDQNHHQTNTNQWYKQWYSWKHKHTHTHAHNSWAEPMFPVDLLRVSWVDENIGARFFAPWVIEHLILVLCTGWR